MDGQGQSKQLANGVVMPVPGFGTYKVPDDADAERAVLAAIEAGYRHIDTAQLYRNEAGVGRAIRTCGVPREQLFVTTKLWNDCHGFQKAQDTFAASLELLGLDYVDLYLIHWPRKGQIPETWRAFEKLYQEKKVRAIGVSNFLIHHLQELDQTAQIKPMVDQIELHPFLRSKALTDFCLERGMVVQAWSPLLRGPGLEHPAILAIAGECGRSPAQVLLRWSVQHGFVPLPKSVRPERMKENLDLFSFALSADQMARLDALDEGRRTGADPDNFSF